jgi:hypothetical protein
MNKILFGLSALLLGALACGQVRPTPVPPNAEGTHAAETMQAAVAGTPGTLLTAPATTVVVVVPPVNTVPPAAGGVSLVIPPGWAASAQTELVPSSNSLDLPAWEVHPAYTHVTIQGYPLQGKLFEPGIFIYPAAEFGQLSTGAAQSINDLKGILAAQGPLPEHLPFLPPLNAAQVFYSNVARLPFQNGTGIRYLTQFDQAPLPVNNNELLYTFQGLTQDGRYYVAAILPVNAAFLSADTRLDTPLPTGGVPFDWNNFEAMPAYLEAVKQKLESTDPSQFTPSLAELDAMISSLTVNLP